MSTAVILDAKKAIESWDTDGGMQKCLDFASNHALSAPSDPTTRDVLFDLLYTLVSATVSIFGRPGLNVSSFVSFARGLIQRLPSTSSNTTHPDTSSSAVFEDVLVDVIYSVDSALEEGMAELKNAAKEEVPAGEDATFRAKQLQALSEDKKTIVNLIQSLVQHAVVRPTVFREHLDFPLLCAGELLADEQTWGRKEVRVRTAAFYKQNKFNLLREQSEGYSKLITEVSALVGPPHSPATGRSSEGEASVRQRARVAWGKVISLIGHFELDPYRALDVILDMFSAQVVAHYDFFLEFIKCSGWSRISQEPMNTSMTVDPVMEDNSKGKEKYDGLEFDEVLYMAEKGNPSVELQARDSLEPDSADVPVCGQILGFKFVHYQTSSVSSDQPTQNGTLASKELYLATALLIRKGLIKLSDIYPHLSPPDEEMAAIEQKDLALARKKLKAPPKVNALTQATALEQTSYSRPRPGNTAGTADTANPEDSKPSPEIKPPLPNQKLELVKALLAVGALRPAFQILGKFPWMVQAHTEVAYLVLRILDVSLSPVSANLSFASRHPAYATSNSFGKTKWSPSGGQQAAPVAHRPALTAMAPPPISNHNTKFNFFYPDWPDWIPRCHSVDEIGNVILPFLRLLGTQLHRDVKSISRLCRIGHSVLSSVDAKSPDEREMSEEEDRKTYAFWLDMLRLYLVPSLSLIRVNSVIGQSVWSLLSLCSPENRWSIYDEWRKLSTGALTTRRYPELVIQASETARETKDILRRLTNNSQGNMFSVPISKLSHSNPTIVLQVTLMQGISYSNFPRFLADSMEYLTPMELDCLTWLVLKIFVDPSRDRVKADGTSLMDWVQNLAQFIGKLLRNHQNLDPELILHYVIHRLRDNDAKELLILREVISNMTSIMPLADLNDKQVQALAAGPLYRAELISQATRGSRSAALHAANIVGEQRLLGTLMRTNLALPLLIAIAQTRANCVYKVKDGEWHPKFMSGLFDECQAVLMQYIEFLTIALGKEYGALLPSLAELCKTYGLEHSVAFSILRPMLWEPVTTFNREAYAQVKQNKENDLKEKLRARAATATPTQPAADMPASKDESPAPTPATLPSLPATPAPPTQIPLWAPALVPLMDSAKEILPQRVLDVLGAPFFVTFWQMSMADLHAPVMQYTDLRKSLTDYIQSKPSSSLTSAEVKLEVENRRLAEKINQGLPLESRVAVENLEATRNYRLQREKSEWFRAAAMTPGFVASELMSQMVQYCLHPRMLLSPSDAEYCGKLVRILHRLGTPGFSTASCYDKVLGDHISAVIVSCSDEEIRNYGRFLRIILGDLAEWFSSESLYTKDCRQSGTGAYLPGFQKKWSSDRNVNPESLFPWSEFCTFIAKLHRKITKSVIRCLTSNEYMHVRNVIKVLYEILPVYPNKANDPRAGTLVETLMRHFREDPRDDIKTIAAGYHSRLLQVKSQWLPEPEPTPTVKSEANAEIKSEPMKTENSTTTLPAKPLTVQAPIPSRPQEGLRSKPVANGNQPSIPLPPNPNLARRSPMPSGVSTPTQAPSQTSLPKGLEGIASIPRPEVIRRNRGDKQDSPKPTAAQSASMDIDKDESQPSPKNVPEQPGDLRTTAGDGNKGSLPSRPTSPSRKNPDARRDNLSQSQRGHRKDDAPPRGVPEMPPPAAPSSKATAQELRASSNKPHEESTSSPVIANGSQEQPGSPRRRSSSPNRPGTRNASVESRSSTGDRPRSERSAAGDRDRERERDKGRERRGGKRESRHDRESDRERVPTGDSTSSRRGGRAHDREGRGEGERARERDREREKDKDKGKDRERDKDRERPEGRHRRESQGVRKEKEREIPTGPSSTRATRRDDDKSRYDASNGRQSAADDNPHKRRREVEEDSIPAKRLRENGSLRDSGRGSRDLPREPLEGHAARDSRDNRDPNRRTGPDNNAHDRDSNREFPARDARNEYTPAGGREGARDAREASNRDPGRERDSRREAPGDTTRERERDGGKDARFKERDDRGRREKDRDDKDSDRERFRDRDRDRRDRNEDADRSSKVDRPRRERSEREGQDTGRDRSSERKDVVDQSEKERMANERSSRSNNTEGREGKLAQSALKSIGASNPPSGPRAMASGEGGRQPPEGPRGSRGGSARMAPHQERSRGSISSVSLKDRIGAVSSGNGRADSGDQGGVSNFGQPLSPGAATRSSGRDRDSPAPEGTLRKRTLSDRAAEQASNGGSAGGTPSGIESLPEKPQLQQQIQPPPQKRRVVNRQGLFAGKMEKN